MTDGTFTITNLGTFGTLLGTPIINQPQVAILGIGAIHKRPVVVGPDDAIAVRSMVYLTLSYDHRVVDGLLGGRFLGSMAKHLGSFQPPR
jgi:2-oxoglutarate dehydrogenase E2 component (dihydrolipoamide succinyltransferase)